MAKLVMSIGMSHSPMMAMDGTNWHLFAEADYHHPMLVDLEGNKATYEELRKKVGERYAGAFSREIFIDQYKRMKAAFRRLREELEACDPDLLIVIANDHINEMLDQTNIPALGVFYGDKLISAKTTEFPFPFPDEAIEEMKVGMGVDDHHVWEGHKEAALHLITSLTEQEFDVSAMGDQKPGSGPAGHGHGFGMVVTELMTNKTYPMVPIYLNAWPPNVLSPSRCYDLGLAIRKAIEEMDDNLRVCFIASGGLSHFVVDEELDLMVLEALRNRDEKTLRNLPRHRLNGGNSEIRNWVVLGAVARDQELAWDEYIPVFRTPVGTGLGMGFARWS